MVGPLRVTSTIVVPERELRWRFSRSSGPGGQHVNTSDSRVELSLDLRTTSAMDEDERARAVDRLEDRLVDGVLTVVASERRSQLRNREIALERLASILREALAPPAPARRPTRATRSSVERRLTDKRRRGRTKKLRKTDEDDQA